MIDAIDQFYDDVKSFTDFNDLTKTQHYVRVPHGWFVIMTDVVNSTRVIEEGRYKDVNSIGAATISLVLETLQNDIPFVFGGDGATLLVPEAWMEPAMKALGGLRKLAASRFDIDLRVGRIAVKELYAAGTEIQVARHELASGKSIAVFRGGGLAEAESRIKNDTERYCLSGQEETEEAVELKGLSCRWNAIPSSKGCVMSLILLSRDSDSPRAYERFLEFCSTTFSEGLDGTNPIHSETMKYKGFWRLIGEEWRYHSNVFSSRFLSRVVEIAAAVAIFKWDIPAWNFDSTHYKKSLRIYSDFRKFDGMLRMVIDCSHEQGNQLRQFLEELCEEQSIYYGIHASDHSLMTCYVQDLGDGGHIHFIDGGDGGYAMAAKQLKAQMNSSPANTAHHNRG